MIESFFYSLTYNYLFSDRSRFWHCWRELPPLPEVMAFVAPPRSQNKNSDSSQCAQPYGGIATPPTHLSFCPPNAAADRHAKPVQGASRQLASMVFLKLERLERLNINLKINIIISMQSILSFIYFPSYFHFIKGHFSFMLQSSAILYLEKR